MILMTRPTFGMYEVYAQRSGARIGYVDYQSSSVGPFLETDQLIERIRSDQPKAVFLPNPDSPTGTVLPPGALRAAIEAAGDVGALFVVDEAYYPFYSESALDWTQEFNHLVILRTTSKAWAMAGLRIGFAVSSESVASVLHLRAATRASR